jgi:DNA topoisomerase-1
MNVVVVESPAKAKTINKYLGSDFRVLASFGHVRDLPPKDGSVRPEQDFAMTYEIDAKSKKQLNEIAQALKGARRLYLATDPDREGEAISWHVLESLKELRKLRPDVEIKRVVFNEITKRAVQEAMKSPRDVDMDLVNAQQARRALDYLVGFTLSPVLWRKMPSAKSAGRVQSVALRLVCEREIEIGALRPQGYWTVEADFATARADQLTARLSLLDGAKVEKFTIADEAAANRARGLIEAQRYRVGKVETKPARRHPAPPFMTSTLQQEASRKLGFSAKRTMQVAQRLYEGVDIGGETVGLITYMRTDGAQMANEAIAAARELIGREFGRDYVPDAPRVYTTKAKNAQEAHEAIRPTDFARKPADVAGQLDGDQRRLYELVWVRALASQMESARLWRTTVDIVSGDGRIAFRASGAVVEFPGFLKLYEEGRDEKAEDDEDRRLPKVEAEEALDRRAVRPERHFTEPPPRYSEATLVKKLEELGIGRPSTYATILSVLQDRGYVRLEKNRFIPEDSGRLVTAFLTNFFERYFAYDFTANLEQQLDEITERRIDWKKVLRDFWRQFSTRHPDEQVSGAEMMAMKDAVEAIDRALGNRTQIIEAIDEALGSHFFPPREDGRDPRLCPACNEGRLGIRQGKSGAFIGCARYPECRYTRPLAGGEAAGEGAPAMEGPKTLGVDPETGFDVTLRNGPFGPYLQLGEAQGKEKPKRISIPKDVTLEQAEEVAFALRLLRLPREVGAHPESGQTISAGIGRYGPYLEVGGKYTNLQSTQDALEIGLNRAVDVLAQPRGRRGATAAPRTPAKSLGAHPDDGEPVTLHEGRYGPYVKHGKVNATIPRGRNPEELTLAQAVELIAERAAKGPGKKPARAAKPAAKKASAKKPARGRKAAPKARAAAE